MSHLVASRDQTRAELIKRADSLHVAVVSDCLDKLGIRDNVLAPHVRPLRHDSRLAGFARTVLLVEVDSLPADPRDYYRLELESVGSLQEGDVIVTSTCHRSYWGELLATACRFRGVRGIVADVYTRDTRRLIDMGFPTFVAGIQAQDSLGRLDVMKIDVPVECAGVLVHPGDLLLGDNDGVVVVPQATVTEVINLAEEKLRTESKMREELAKGMPMTAAFAKYRIL
jgi:4-hydroxy-4-methyl-2-oxoglutarate aldolase